MARMVSFHNHVFGIMSSKLIYGDEERLLPWALSRVGVCQFRTDAHSIGLERDGELVAVVVFDGFSDFDCNMHVASDGTTRWMTKEYLLSVFAYPFTQLGLRRVTGLVPASNAKALAFDEHIGFVREGYHPHAMGDDDLISLGLLRENCRFISKEHRA
jgi:RimJ/RimL family protein N-acetyltransferase